MYFHMVHAHLEECQWFHFGLRGQLEKKRLRFHVMGLSRFRRLETTRMVSGSHGQSNPKNLLSSTAGTAVHKLIQIASIHSVDLGWK